MKSVVFHVRPIIHCSFWVLLKETLFSKKFQKSSNLVTLMVTVINCLLELLVSSMMSTTCSVSDCGSDDVPLLVNSMLELSLSDVCSAEVL